MVAMIDFTIITPSLDMLRWLKCCVASVNDQKVNHEHIIVDGGSTDGTVEWLKKQDYLIKIIDADNGMYEAINKGIKVARGNYIAYLNSDEQYLEDVLSFIYCEFEKHPDADIIYGNRININEDGSFNSFKKTLRFNKNYILSSSLYIPSCALFFRRKIFDEGNYFDESYRSCGDAEFFIRLDELGYRFKLTNRYISTFAIRKNNLSQNNYSLVERKRLEESFNINKTSKVVYKMAKMGEKLITGKYIQRFPLKYSIYCNNADIRQNYIVKRGSFITDWKK